MWTDTNATDRAAHAVAHPPGAPQLDGGDISAQGGHPTATADANHPGSRRRWAAAAVAAVALGAATAVIVTRSSGEDAEAVVEPPTVETATAATVDLVEFTDLDGTLTYAATSTVTSNAEGVVTDLIVADALVERGDVAVAVDGRPVTVMYGDVPFYRELADESEGDDVLLLEQNLAALGYHVAEFDEDGNPVDEELVVDGVFDEATTAAVERWQDDLGVEATGVVLPTDATVLAGPSQVTELAVSVGDRVAAGAPLFTLNQLAEDSTGPATTTSGRIELFITSGQTLASGDVVYAIDDEPVTAVVTSVEFTRDVEAGIEPGEDVRVIEEMLVALDYDADGEIVVDDEFDDATETAIEDWQADLANTFPEIDVDGEIDPEELLVLTPGETVGDVAIDDGAVVASGTLLWTTSAETTSRIVTTSVPVADQDTLPVGSEVTIELPDGEEVTGVVDTVASSSTVDPTDPAADPELEVEIVLATVPPSVEAFAELDVTVKVVDEIAAGVTAVPASALVATGDGGYAVEVVENGGTRFVAVEPGMFNDGLVEVSGIDVGTDVVVAS